MSVAAASSITTFLFTHPNKCRKPGQFYQPAITITPSPTARTSSDAFNFALPFKDGRNIAYSLPCEWRRFQQVLKNQRISRWNDDEYAYRVAWANIRDWVASQMALYETEMVDIPQIFLPFAVGNSGRTLYEHVQTNPGFLLGDGS